MISLQDIDPSASYLAAAAPLGHMVSWSRAADEPVCFEYRLAEIVTPRRRFELTQPTFIRLAWEGESWSAQSDDFSILAFGATSSAAIESFCEDFDVMWHMIGTADSAALTPKAARVKEALLGAVKKIEIK